MKINFLKYGKATCLVSAILAVFSVALILLHPPKLGIDFTGGVSVKAWYESAPDVLALENMFKEEGIPVSIQGISSNGVLLIGEVGSNVEDIKSLLGQTEAGTPNEITESFVGPTLGKELVSKGITAFIIIAISLILFVAYAFRKVSVPISSFSYGFVVIVTLFHDVLLASGAYALVALFSPAQIDSLFVVALLTVMGLSVNDTIVVFDRVRENLKSAYDGEGKFSGSFKDIVEKSLKETIWRSFTTSFAVILVLLALVVFGPDSTKMFSLTILFGMIFGTYSSLFVASPLLAMLAERKIK